MSNLSLEDEVKQLRVRVEWLDEVVIKALGVNGPWLPPKQAASLLSVSPQWLLNELRLAEAIRAIKDKPHLLYGVHYLDAQSSNSSQSTWKINVPEMAKFLKLPPDQRKPPEATLRRVDSVLSSAS